MLLASGKSAIEPRSDRYDDWYARSQAELRDHGVVTTQHHAQLLQRRPRRCALAQPPGDWWTTGRGRGRWTRPISSCGEPCPALNPEGGDHRKVKDLTGPGLTDQFGVTCTDLGASVLAADGHLVSVFGDTFSGNRLGPGTGAHR